MRASVHLLAFRKNEHHASGGSLKEKFRSSVMVATFQVRKRNMMLATSVAATPVKHFLPWWCDEHTAALVHCHRQTAMEIMKTKKKKKKKAI